MGDICEQLHREIWKSPRHTFPFSNEDIPKNGIYFLFEKGELSHGGERIVRVGTHTGEAQLCSRLHQHFLVPNKDRSIFRKNIGRALLNKVGSPFLKEWEIDRTSSEARQKHGIAPEEQKRIEEEVTQYMQDAFSFVVVPVADKKTRLELEAKCISTLSWCEDCRPSNNWLGNYSPKEKIRQSGLWLVNELYKDGATMNDLRRLLSGR